jgi:integrase
MLDHNSTQVVTTDKPITATTTAPTNGKPAKPFDNFPLFAHANGRWAKKIKGRLVYFGLWSDPAGALRDYLKRKADLYAGKETREAVGEITVKQLCNKFLAIKQRRVDTGELSPLMFQDYKAQATLVVKSFRGSRAVSDLQPDDFGRLRNVMSKSWGFYHLTKAIQMTRSIFLFGYKDGLLEKPMRFGSEFDRPTKKTMRLHVARQGSRLFTPVEIHQLIGAASVQIRAMLYLGINCAFGNADCGAVPLSALDLDNGWVNFARVKTGIQRKIPLWPETVSALRAAIAERIAPKKPEHANLVFVTRLGGCWKKETKDGPLSREVIKLLRELGIHRRGLGFYSLRHCFETYGGESRDQVAVDAIMGHADDSMAANYRHGVSEERLRAVVETVHKWLGDPPGKGDS